MNIAEIKKEIEIPDNVTANYENEILTIKGEKGELKRTYSHPKLNVLIKDKKIIVQGKNLRRKQKALIGTYEAHIKNMIKGVTEGFEYKMKTVFSHFPIKTTVEDKYFIIQNFLGER